MKQVFQQPNSPTAQQPNSPTAQQPNSPAGFSPIKMFIQTDHTEYNHSQQIALGTYHRSNNCSQICSCDDETCFPICPIHSTY
jgi:hypothetical protein